jgi:steroid delta-isomerase
MATLPPSPAPRAAASAGAPEAPGAGPTPEAPDADAALARAVRFFETLSPASLAEIETVYAADARFVDPFNDLRGTRAIAAVFEHMYAQLDAPRFEVREAFARGDQGFVTWDFVFRFRRGSPRGPQTVHGSTHFRFDPRGRIVLHRDYWDAAGELYEKLPVIGAPLRWLRRRLAVKAA